MLQRIHCKTLCPAGLVKDIPTALEGALAPRNREMRLHVYNI